MASTRNLNTKYDYLCEKKQNNKMLEYMTDKTYGVHENPAFWDLGFQSIDVRWKSFP